VRGTRRMVLIICALCVGNAVYAIPPSFPVPPGAENVSIQINPGGVEQDTFSIRLTYPSKLVLNHYQKFFGKWTELCPNADDWQYFVDGTKVPPQSVKQLLRHWVRGDGKKSVLLGLRYISAGDQAESPPASDVQNVALLIFDGNPYTGPTEAWCGIAH
jgi:hypothetical protein